MHRRLFALVILGMCLAPRGGSAAEAVIPPPEPAGIPYSIMAPIHRDRVKAVVDQPTVTAQGPAEAFLAPPEVYRWLLGHPQDAFRIWQSLGAKCSIPDVDDKGRFHYDETGRGTVVWEAVAKGKNAWVWLCEGKGRPAPLLPIIEFDAVVVVHYVPGKDGEGNPAIRHQYRFYLKTDSKAINLAAKILGASVPKMADNYVGQLQYFFAALSWWLDQHPEKAQELLKDTDAPVAVLRGK